MIRNKTVRLCTVGAIFAAMIAVATSFVKVPIPASDIGYVHVGDALIFLAAAVLPAPYAVAAAVIGASFADLLYAPIWIPATIIIKAASTFCFTCRGKMLCARNIAALVASALFCSGGYYIYEALIFGNYVSPLAFIPSNLAQSGVSIVIFVVLALLFDRVPALQNIRRGIQ